MKKLVRRKGRAVAGSRRAAGGCQCHCHRSKPRASVKTPCKTTPSVAVYAIRILFPCAAPQNDHRNMIFLKVCGLCHRTINWLCRRRPNIKNFLYFRAKPRHVHAPRSRRARKCFRRAILQIDLNDRRFVFTHSFYMIISMKIYKFYIHTY